MPEQTSFGKHIGANELKFPDNLEEIVTKGVQNAKKAVEETGKDGLRCTRCGSDRKAFKATWHT